MPNHLVPLLAVLALSCWAVYRQTTVAEVRLDAARFKLPAIYGAVGIALIVIDGWQPPHGAGWAVLVASVVLSAVVGAARGRLTHIWKAEGKILRQGTWLTIGLFIAMVAIKVAAGLVTAMTGVATEEGAGELMIIIAIMVAMQAEIVKRRAEALSSVSLAAARTATPR